MIAVAAVTGTDQAAGDLLLIEDDPADLELTLRALRQRGLGDAVIVARDGEQALALLRRAAWRPRVVLLDLKLPKVDGLEVLRAVRAEERTREVPVVVLTSSAEGRDVEAAYRLGANSYLVKPITHEAFVERVTALGLYWLVENQVPW